jgi:hypothetical protein
MTYCVTVGGVLHQLRLMEPRASITWSNGRVSATCSCGADLSNGRMIPVEEARGRYAVHRRRLNAIGAEVTT